VGPVLFCDLFPFLNPPFSLVLSSASNRIISAKDHASIQINIADVDETTGRMTGTNKTYAICGAIRKMGESDDCINRLAKKDGIIAK
jgi:small subunit ribosomal protein S21e